MWEGFLYIEDSQKVRIELGTMSLTIPDKQPNQVGFIPYIYLLTYSTGKGHEQSIYPKHPYTHFKENQNPFQRKTSVGYIPKVVLTRDSLFYIAIRKKTP